MRFLIPIGFAILSSASLPLAYGQVDRYELGQRLKRFEIAWQSASPARRDQSVEPMQQAVQSFFGLQLRQAAARLDEAYFAVRSDSRPDNIDQFLSARRIKIAPYLIENQSPESSFKLEDYYPTSAPVPEACSLRLRAVDADGVQVYVKNVSLQDALQGIALGRLSQLPEGDHDLLLERIEGEVSTVVSRTKISKIGDFPGRLAAVESKDAALRAGKESSVTASVLASVKDWLQILRHQAAGRVLESDYPSHRLLKACESVVSNPWESSKIVRQLAEQGDVWLTLSDGKKSCVTRVRAPQVSKNPIPVLFAFHGAGGSENMFFETYGAGRLVQLATERGWLVVSPRQGILGPGMDCQEMLDALGAFFDIDRNRIYLVGHSMGAGQVMRQVAKQPDLACAAVAIGGGGSVQKVNARIPWFVSAGEKDFGKGGARSLADSLKALGSPVTYLEVPKVEHMVIVQASLDQVFSFLDGCSPLPK